MIRPAALRPGARIALVAPAGPLAEEAVERALQRLKEWGYQAELGRHARERYGYLSAPDAPRAADFNTALAEPGVDAVWCLRGGYGVMRILPRLDWAELRRHPRPVIGFSDITALHLALQREGLVSFHGPHPATATLTPFSERCLFALLRGDSAGDALPLPEGAPPVETLVGGVAEGPLVGGNLSLLAALCGTPWALRARGAILFIEEVGEAAYRVDRLLTQLRLSGALEGVSGVVVGAFTEAPDAGAEYIPPLREVLYDRLGDLGVPVACGFPFGHVEESWTLPLGVPARMDADAGTLTLLETATQ